MAGVQLNKEQHTISVEKIIHRSEKRHYKESVIAKAPESMDRNYMRSFYAAINGAPHRTAPLSSGGPVHDR